MAATTLGDRSRAGELLDAAERHPPDDAAPVDRTRALVGATRAAFCLAQGDLPGADGVLREAYAAAWATRELPVLASVAVTVAALAAGRGWPCRSAPLLGTAARLRGAHDRTDPQVRELTRRGEAAVGLSSSRRRTRTGGNWNGHGRDRSRSGPATSGGRDIGP
ncbi:hypothetical protein ABZ436_23575 [Micromonospora matsumotoense]|uniref:hypothetical protein n=1 Tax=Micromonospora matsumotoense TaxID=121616 RepID=UPI00340E2B56